MDTCYEAKPEISSLVFVSYYRNNSMQEKCTVSGCIITDRSI